MALSKKAQKAIKRYNELIKQGIWPKDIVKILKKEGYKSRNGKFYTTTAIKSAAYASGIYLDTLDTFKKVFIPKKTLKEAMIESVKSSIQSSSVKFSINRETLRRELKEAYPYLYKKMKDKRVQLLFLKTKESGYFKKNGFIFDKKFKPLIDKYKIVDNGKGYAKIGNYYYHRFITNCPKDMQVDHVNRNTRDNRINNLRIATAYQNSGNSKYKGYVKYNDLNNKYCIFFGGYKCFYTKKEAILEYRRRHIERFGEFSPWEKEQK